MKAEIRLERSSNFVGTLISGGALIMLDNSNFSVGGQRLEGALIFCGRATLCAGQNQEGREEGQKCGGALTCLLLCSEIRIVQV